MGGTKQKKGKERKDHYYNLAKLQGYRARSSFKLIHLAQKFDFFASCQSVIDLCAAPGGWLQVAKQNLPMNSKIVGVDLMPIRKIPGCVTIRADITTATCRSLLCKEMKTGTVDLVLHDGAPNVGTDWSHDAYVQNELTLSATKLASEFLRPGGSFVSKIFRSNDYLCLLYVLNRLFGRVQVTKPQSSRDESAEIFAICTGYLAPMKVDPKFFDPKFAFADAESKTEIEASLGEATGTKEKTSVREILKSRGRRNREGYVEGADYSEVTAKAFLDTSNPAVMVTSKSKITFPSPECDEIRNSPHTTDAVAAACDDLKVLGYSDLMMLIRWRKRLMKEAKLLADRETVEGESDVESAQQGEESGMSDAELERLVQEEEILQKRTDRKQRTKEKKNIEKRRITQAGWGAGDDDDDVFRFAEHGKLLLADGDGQEPEESAAEERDCSDSDEDSDEEGPAFDEFGNEIQKTIHVPLFEHTIAPDDNDARLAEIEQNLDMEYRIKKAKKLRQDAAIASIPLEHMKRKKRMQIERKREIDGIEGDIQERARQLFFEKQALEVQESEEEAVEEAEMETDGSDHESTAEEPKKTTDSHAIDFEAEDEAESSGDCAESYRTSRSAKRVRTSASFQEDGEDMREKALRILRAKRLFSQPMFSGVGVGLVSSLDEFGSGHMNSPDPGQNPLEGSKDERKLDCDEPEDRVPDAVNGVKSESEDLSDAASDDDHASDTENRRPKNYNKFNPPDSMFPYLPLCDKKIRKIQRAKAKERAEMRRKRDAADAKKTMSSATDAGLGVEDLPFEKQDIEVVPSPAVSKVERAAAKYAVPTPQKPENANDLAEVQALGYLMSKKETRMDLIDNGWNRAVFNDEDCVPEWFADDEAKVKLNRFPMTKELVKEYRSRIKEIQQRPIRKVIEAKLRKQKRAKSRLKSINKKANIIASSPDMNEASRAQAIQKALSKAKKADERPKNYLVSRTGGGALALRRESGGPKNAVMKVVDKRMKADKRGAAARSRKKGKKHKLSARK